MEYFKSSLKSVLGAPPPENLPTGADTVRTLFIYNQTVTAIGMYSSSKTVAFIDNHSRYLPCCQMHYCSTFVYIQKIFFNLR